MEFAELNGKHVGATRRVAPTFKAYAGEITCAASQRGIMECDMDKDTYYNMYT